jgi:hypothetical protein
MSATSTKATSKRFNSSRSTTGPTSPIAIHAHDVDEIVYILVDKI